MPFTFTVTRLLAGLQSVIPSILSGPLSCVTAIGISSWQWLFETEINLITLSFYKILNKFCNF